MNDLTISFAPHAFDAFKAVSGGFRTGGLHGLHVQVREHDGTRHNGQVTGVYQDRGLRLETAPTFGDDLGEAVFAWDAIESLHVY